MGMTKEQREIVGKMIAKNTEDAKDKIHDALMYLGPMEFMLAVQSEWRMLADSVSKLPDIPHRSLALWRKLAELARQGVREIDDIDK